MYRTIIITNMNQVTFYEILQKNILNNRNTTQQATQKIISKILCDSDSIIKNSFVTPQESIIKASIQISINNSLKESLKQLKTQPNKTIKKNAIFGEIFDNFSVNNQASENNPFEDYNFDFNKTNIFKS